MPAALKEIKNVPISFSILHELEYNNICILLKTTKRKVKKRRAFSEKSSDMYNNEDEQIQFKLYEYRRKTLKN